MACIFMPDSVETPPPARLAAYMRVSRIGGREGDGYIAIPQQRERCEGFAEFRDAVIPDEGWFSDEDYSGGNTQRPGFLDAIAAVEAGRFDGLVVARIDRFSRNIEDGAQMVRRILEAGGMFQSATEALDVRDPVGEYMLIAMLNNAQLQLRQLERGWLDSKVSAVRKRGVHIGPTPFGYLRIPKHPSDARELGLRVELWERSGWLIPHPTEAEPMSHCFEMRLRGASYADMGRYLDRVCPRKHQWAGNTIKRMLTNRTYLGEVHYRNSKGDRSKDLINLEAHEPLTDPSMFNAVGETLQEGQRKVSSVGSFFLSGLTRCWHCRYAAGGFGKAGTNRDTPVYRCISRGARCEGRPMVNAVPLDELVVERFWGYAADRLSQRTRPATQTAGRDGGCAVRRAGFVTRFQTSSESGFMHLTLRRGAPQIGSLTGKHGRFEHVSVTTKATPVKAAFDVGGGARAHAARGWNCFSVALHFSRRRGLGAAAWPLVPRRT
jgi:DNA invertase Pin-like site-specific DNA recombinase